MARTPLLRALRQLAGEHDAAEQLGVPVEELRARREEQAYSRKDFLKRTGAVGAALAAAGPAGALVRSARGATAPRIAIVGGGIAGLTTALTLQDRGIGVHGLRSPSVADRRPHALRLRRLSRLLGQRPGSRAVRRADRHGAQDDPRARQAVQPGDRRPARRRAERLDRHVPLLRRLLPRRRGRSRLQGDPRGAAPRPVRGELSDDLQDLDARGDRPRQHEHLRVDRVPRAGRPLVAVRPAARRRLQHRVRRRDDRAVRAQPRLPARLLRRCALALRPVRRAIPHRRRQHPAPDRDPRLDRAVAGRFGSTHGLAAELGEGERRRHGRARVRLPGREADRDGRSRRAVHELQRAARRSTRPRPASIRSRRPRSRSSARAPTRSCSSSSRTGSGTRPARGDCRTAPATRTPATRTPGT